VLAELIELVARIWQADSEIRESSVVGESEMDRRSRRFVSWVCGTIIALLVLVGVAWWWLVGHG
jgi:MoxR-like ATPase